MSPEAAASSYATSQLPTLGPAASWQVRASTPYDHGRRAVRLVQLHAGIPVVGGDIVVHLDGAKVASMSGNVVPSLDGVEVTPELEPARAREAAMQEYLSRVTNKTDQLRYDQEKIGLVILPGEGARPSRLAWHISFHTELQGGVPPGVWSSFYDARTGKLLKAYNSMPSSDQASGPGGNEKAPRTWSGVLDVVPTNTPDEFKMETSRVRTRDMGNATLGSGSVVSGPLNPIGDEAINDAHAFTEITLDMMAQWQNRNSVDGAGLIIINKVHYGTNYENAQWNQDGILYGDGAAKRFALSTSLDLVAHEIAHGFTEFESNLSYGSHQSGALNESFSDVSGEIAEAFFKNAAPDFDHGRDNTRGDTATRFLCNPTADGVSIDHFSNFTENRPFHYTAGIGNKAFCLTAHRFGSGSPAGIATVASVKRASRAWYRANQFHWTSMTTFQQACEGILDAAVTLGFTIVEQEMIRQSWADVGVACGAPLKQHELFRDANNHVRAIFNDGSQWTTNLDLTATTNAVVADGEPFGYSLGADRHVIFRDGTNRVHELYFNGSFWVDNDLTTLAGGAGAALDPMGYTLGSTQHIVFKGTDGNVRELYNNGSFWVNNNLTSFISGSTPPAGKPFGYTLGNTQHIVFRAANGDVHELYNNGSFWTDNNLTAIFGGPGAATDPMGYVSGNEQHIVFKGTDGNLRELYNNGSFWMNNNLTATIPGSAVPAGRPFGYAAGITQHIVFRSSDDHLHEVFNNGSFWVDNDLTAHIPGSVGPAADPMGYFNGGQHIVFRGTDGQVHEVFNGGLFWVNNNLSAIVGGSTPINGVTGYFSR